MSEYEQALLAFIGATKEYAHAMRKLHANAPRIDIPAHEVQASVAVKECRHILLEALNEMPHMAAVIRVPS